MTTAPPAPVLPPRVVLHRPLYGGNVGSSARAMTNMGLAELVLSQPRFENQLEAEMMATGSAREVLDGSRRVDDLGAAVEGCTVVVACTARPRRWKAWACLGPGEAAALLVERGALGEPTAFLFGTEDSGLAQEDLAWATHLCHIPTAPEHSSLNLSQAVLLLAWEWAQARGAIRARPRRRRRRGAAEIGQVRGAAAQAGALLDRIGFWTGRNREQGEATLQQALLRGEMTETEIHFLRGVIGKLGWHLDFGERRSPQERAEASRRRREQSAVGAPGTQGPEAAVGAPRAQGPLPEEPEQA